MMGLALIPARRKFSHFMNVIMKIRTQSIILYLHGKGFIGRKQ